MSVKFLGNRTLYDENGQEISVKMQSVQGSDTGFTKVWLTDFMLKLDLIGNQKLTVAFWIIEHIQCDTNMLLYSQREIAKECNVSLQTVNITIKALQQADFIRCVKRNVYILNPDVLFQGLSANKRQGILTEYLLADNSEEMSDEDKIKSLEKTISEMTKRKKELEKKQKDLDDSMTNKYLELNELYEKKSN